MRSKTEMLVSARLLISHGYTIYATGGTHEFLMNNNIPSQRLYWPDEKTEPNTYTYIREKKIDLVINIPKDFTKQELDNGYIIRRASVDFNIPLITNARLASAFIYAITRYKPEQLSVKSWEEY
jgi:carbamoyl-phosphate synthase large subunit